MLDMIIKIVSVSAVAAPSALTRLAIANGCFFNIGSRLARYTRNETYAKFADETWDWLWGVGYIDHESWLVYDGGRVQFNCTDINKATFSYNAAIMTQGAAFMYNYVSLISGLPAQL